jgi:hypothetical protein
MASLMVCLVSGGCGDGGKTAESGNAAGPDAAAAASSAQDRSCPDDGGRLPLTGLCEGRAVNYLNMDASVAEEAPDGCEWKVMETQMVEDVLLYRGLKCDAGETRLEYAGGAHRADLELVSSAFLGKIDEPPAYVQVYTIEGDAREAIAQRAREAMQDKAEAAGCKARLAGFEGWPSDALVVDVSAEEAAKAPQDEPRTACGPLGLAEDSVSFWRTAHGYGWFFELGQDAFEIDPGSFTLMTKGPDGTWAPL